MTKEQRRKCHAIIHGASLACGGVGAGLAQLPGTDNAVIVPIQIAMTVALGGVFGISLSESTAKSALATATATVIGRGISQFLVGWIPVIGNAINATVAATVTESIGWTIARDFSSHSKAAGKTFALDPEKTIEFEPNPEKTNEYIEKK